MEVIRKRRLLVLIKAFDHFRRNTRNYNVVRDAFGYDRG